MAADALLRIKVITDASQAALGLDNVGKKAKGFQGVMAKAALPAAAVGAALVAVGAKAIKSASDLQQAQGAVESIFGNQAGAVEELSKNSANSMGLAQSAYLQYAAVVGAALTNAGFTTKQAVGESNKIMQRGADMAATFGGTTADAVEAINAAVSRGEFDPLEKYGVSLNMTAVNAELAARGQDKLTGSALKHAKAQVVLDSVYKNTAKSAGQFARESDTAAGSAAIASANFENASAALGQALLPAATACAKVLATMARWIQQNATLVLILAAGVGVLVTAILLYNAAMKIAAIVQTAFNVAMSANVIFLVIVAIIALIAVIIIVVKKWDAIRAAAVAAWGKIMDIVGVAVDFIKKNWLKMLAVLLGPLGVAVLVVVRNWSKIRAGAAKVFDWIKSATRAVASVFKTIWRAAMSAVTAYFRSWKTTISAIMSAIRTIIRAATDMMKAVFRSVKDTVSNVFSSVKDKVSNVASAIKTTIGNAVDRVKATLGNIRDALSSLVPAGFAAKLSAPFNAVKQVIDSVKRAIDGLISAVGNLISKIAGIHFPSIPSGIGKFLGKVGLSAAVPGAGAGLVRPRVFYPAPTVAGRGAGAGGRASFVGGEGAGVVININGALDPESVARQIRTLLNTSDVRMGRRTA